MEKIKMKELESKLAYYKMIVNSSYGSQSVTKEFNLKSEDVYSEVFKIRNKIRIIKMRKSKIKNLFDGR